MVALALLIAALGLTPIQGPARVIDGDTIVISGEHIRLEGIDAPERNQICHSQSDWKCGVVSGEQLKLQIGTQVVRCVVSGRDRYKRALGTCSTGTVNLNEWMVVSGWAVAYRRYGSQYVLAEDFARKEQRGIWKSEFEMPWEWRAEERRR